MFFYLMFLNIYYWAKLTFSKLVGKVNFSKRKFEEMHQLWRAKRYKVYSGKPLFWHYYLQLSFVYKTVSQTSFKLFCLGDKRLLSEFLGNEVDFRDIMNIFANILAKNQNFKKLRQFCRLKSLDNNDINIFLSLENSLPFCLQKKRP